VIEHPNGSPPTTPARLRLLAERIHQLGPGPLCYLLTELVDGGDPLPRLEAYAKLAPLASFITAFDGDQLPGLRVVDGGRR
jgi:hypothetical protein